jgi:hypothetical protein
LIVVCFLLSSCTNFFFFQSLKQLLATNQQAKAASHQQASTLKAEELRQTTLTQCFSPPFAAAPASSSGYTKIMFKGEPFLVNASTKHMMPMPDTEIPRHRFVSERAQSMSPIDLAQDSFSSSPEVAPPITPSVRQAAKRPPSTTQSNVVLSENNGSDEEIVYVCQRRKKKKLAPFLPALQSSDKVQVVDQSGLSLEVKSQGLPKTGRFGDYHAPPAAEEAASLGSKTVADGSANDKSVNLSADDSDE